MYYYTLLYISYIIIHIYIIILFGEKKSLYIYGLKTTPWDFTNATIQNHVHCPAYYY